MVNLIPKQEFDRGQWGRPKIIRPDGRETTYTRCTTFVDVLEDKTMLGQYDMRMVAAGLGQRPDLHMRAASLGLEPVGDQIDPSVVKQWKKDMYEVAKSAKEAARASAKATVGSGLHAFTERMDRGQPIGHVPDEYRKHLATWERVTAGIQWHYIEQPTVCDELEVAGTPDRIGIIPGHPGGVDRLAIADTKSGRTDFGTLKMAMQLAVYAHSVLYDVRTGQRTTIDVDHQWGFILPLDAVTGECEPFWINIDLGWQAVQLAKTVREWRKLNKNQLTRAYQQPTQPQLSIVPDHQPAAQAPGWGAAETVQPPRSEVDAALVHAITSARTTDDLNHLFFTANARGQWQAHHTHLAAARKAELLKGIPA